SAVIGSPPASVCRAGNRLVDVIGGAQICAQIPRAASGGVASGHHPLPGRIAAMLETIAIILIVLWALGLVTGYALGGFIHILLVLAIIVVLIRIIQGRKPV
ncbi:MAG TPA: lmo0937 family membrane protein, partial [Gemmatimonadales bacterium]|nr:lmo0937 family membrane protein [Gemmatimonadales bacterium]